MGYETTINSFCKKRKYLLIFLSVMIVHSVPHVSYEVVEVIRALAAPTRFAFQHLLVLL